MEKNHDNNNNPKEGNRMRNEHIVTTELAIMGSNLKHNGDTKQIAIYNSMLRIIQGGQFNLVRPTPKSYYVRGRKLSELKPITIDDRIKAWEDIRNMEG